MDRAHRRRPGITSHCNTSPATPSLPAAWHARAANDNEKEQQQMACSAAPKVRCTKAMPTFVSAEPPNRSPATGQLWVARASVLQRSPPPNRGLGTPAHPWKCTRMESALEGKIGGAVATLTKI